MQWFKYTRNISPKSNVIVFTAKISQKGGWEVLSDKIGFSPLFEAIAKGEYTIEHIQNNDYEEWIKNPSKALNFNTIKFNNNPLKNIEDFINWESNIGYVKSSLNPLPLNQQVNVTFESPYLIPDDGYQPQALAITTRIIESFINYIKMYDIGETAMLFRPSSAGYEIFTSKQNPECEKFLNAFCNFLNGDNIPIKDDPNLNALINEFKKIKYINLNQLTFEISNNKTFIFNKYHFENVEPSYQARNVSYEGIPHKVTIIRNRFNLKTDFADYACHLFIDSDVQSMRELLDNIHTYGLSNSKIIVEGTIEDEHPMTIKIDNTDNIKLKHN